MPKEYLSTKRIHSQEMKRKQIWSAMCLLLQNKPLDSISIQEVCDQAGIHRTTFYNHFYDIYDLISYGSNQILKEVFPEEQVENISVDLLTENVIHFVKEYRKLFLNVTKTEFQENLRAATQDAFEEYLLQIVKKQEGQYKTTLPVETAIRFYCGGAVSLMFYWFENPEIEIEVIRPQMKEIVHMTMRGLMGE